MGMAVENLVKRLRQFWLADEGQDIIEYALLLAFVCMAAAALVSSSGRNVKGIWSSLSSVLTSVTAAS